MTLESLQREVDDLKRKLQEPLFNFSLAGGSGIMPSKIAATLNSGQTAALISGNTMLQEDIQDMLSGAATFTAMTLSAQNALTFTHATAEIIPGATSLTFRNNADNASNIVIADAGGITFRAGLSGITTLGLSGILTSTNDTDSTAITNGSIITAGGVGITKALWVGGLINGAGGSTVGTNGTPAASFIASHPNSGDGGIAFMVADLSTTTWSNPLIYSYKRGATNFGSYTLLGFNNFLNAAGSNVRINSNFNGWALSHNTRNTADPDLQLDVISSSGSQTQPFTFGVSGDFTAIRRGLFGTATTLTALSQLGATATHGSGVGGAGLYIGDTTEGAGTDRNIPLVFSWKGGSTSGAYSILGFNYYINAAGSNVRVNTAKGGWYMSLDQRNSGANDLYFGEITSAGTDTFDMFYMVGGATPAAFFKGALTTGAGIATSAPTGGAGVWELGIANSVSPTSPNRTITIEIGGTAYYIHAKTTND